MIFSPIGVKLPQDSTKLPTDGNSGSKWSRPHQGGNFCGIRMVGILYLFPSQGQISWLLWSLVLPGGESTELDLTADSATLLFHLGLVRAWAMSGLIAEYGAERWARC